MTTPTITFATDRDTTDVLVVTIPICPPKTVSPNHRSANWWAKARGNREFHQAALLATSEAAGIPIRLLGGGGSFNQGAYTAPDWLIPAYEAMETRRAGGRKALPRLLILDAVITWPGAPGALRQQQDDGNAIGSLKPALDGLCTALALNDRLVRIGSIQQMRSRPDDQAAWLYGRTELTLRPLTRKDRLP